MNAFVCAFSSLTRNSTHNFHDLFALWAQHLKQEIGFFIWEIQFSFWEIQFSFWEIQLSFWEILFSFWHFGILLWDSLTEDVSALLTAPYTTLAILHLIKIDLEHRFSLLLVVIFLLLPLLAIVHMRVVESCRVVESIGVVGQGVVAKVLIALKPRQNVSTGGGQ